MSNHERTSHRDTSYDDYRATLSGTPHVNGYWLEACKVCNDPLFAVIDLARDEVIEGETRDRARAMWRVAKMADIPLRVVRYVFEDNDITGFEVCEPGETTGDRMTPEQYAWSLVEERREHYKSAHPEHYEGLTETGNVRPKDYQTIVEERAYSLWHRPDSLRRFMAPRVADSLIMIDLDTIELCARDEMPVALIETAQTKDQRKRLPEFPKTARISTLLGKKAGLPVYSLNYILTGSSLRLVHVRRDDTGDRTSDLHTPTELAAWLGSLRLDHDLLQHAGASVST